MLLNAVFTVLIASIVIVIGAWLTHRFIVARGDDALLADLAVLRADFHVEGSAGLAHLIDRRISADPEGLQLYLFTSRTGRHLAGNLDPALNRAPSKDDWWTVRISHQGRLETGRALTHTFPDGSRLVLGVSDRKLGDLRTAIVRAVGITMLVAVLLSILAGYVTARAPLRQIDTITRTAESIIGGDLSQRVPLRGGGDEFERLGSAFNTMLDRVTELMGALRSATDNIAHDLRTPLTRLKQRIETTLSEYAERDIPHDVVRNAAVEIDHVLHVFGSLLRLATIESGVQRRTFTRVELSALAQNAILFYEPAATERGIVIEQSGIRPGHVDGDRDLLFQAICNLLDNAIKFSPDGGLVSVDVLDRHRRVEIVVADGGPGIPAPERERVFDRLVRLEPSRRMPGYGLGLSVVRAVARLHRGDARILASDIGTCVAIDLPRADL